MTALEEYCSKQVVEANEKDIVAFHKLFDASLQNQRRRIP